MSAEIDDQPTSDHPMANQPVSCSTVRELLVAHLDRELGPEDEGKVRDHVAACPACKRELELQLRVSSTLDGIYAARPSADLPMAQRVRRRLEADRRRLRHIVLGAAAGVLVVLGSWWMISSSRQSGTLDSGEEPSLIAIPADDELLENLDVLESLEEEGVDLTAELVQVLLDEESELDDDVLDEIFEYLLEEEVLADQL